MVGNMLSVKKALMWIECWLMNLVGYEGWYNYKGQLKIGLVIVQTVIMADLDFEQLCTLWLKLKLICAAVFKRVDPSEYKEYAAFYQLSQFPLDKIDQKVKKQAL